MESFFKIHMHGLQPLTNWIHIFGVFVKPLMQPQSRATLLSNYNLLLPLSPCPILKFILSLSRFPQMSYEHRCGRAVYDFIIRHNDNA